MIKDMIKDKRDGKDGKYNKVKYEKFKKERIEKLAHQYFIQQKVREVGLTIYVIILFAIFIPLLGFYGYDAFPKLYCSDGTTPSGLFTDSVVVTEQSITVYQCNYNRWSYGMNLLAGLFILALIIMLGLIFFLIGYVIYQMWRAWIKSNWDAAYDRANREVFIARNKRVGAPKPR